MSVSGILPGAQPAGRVLPRWRQEMAAEAERRRIQQRGIDFAVNSSLGLSPGMPGYRTGGVAQGSRTFNSQGRGGVVPRSTGGYGGGVVPRSTGGYGGGFVPPATGGYNNPNPFRSLNGPPAGGGYGPSRVPSNPSPQRPSWESDPYYQTAGRGQNTPPRRHRHGDHRLSARQRRARDARERSNTGGGFRMRTQAEINSELQRGREYTPVNFSAPSLWTIGSLGYTIYTGGLGSVLPWAGRQVAGWVAGEIAEELGATPTQQRVIKTVVPFFIPGPGGKGDPKPVTGPGGDGGLPGGNLGLPGVGGLLGSLQLENTVQVVTNDLIEEELMQIVDAEEELAYALQGEYNTESANYG